MLSNPFLNFIPAIERGIIGNGYDWGKASVVTICGLVIVFSMLVLLVVVISIFGGIMDRVKGVKKGKPVNAPAPAPVSTTAPIVTVEDDNDETIAVIAAAVDAIYADTGVKPVIRRIKPSATNGTRSAWASVGLFQNTRAF